MEPPEKVNKSVSRVGVTCEQALQLGKRREVTREQHAKGEQVRGTRSLAVCLARHKWRACSQASVDVEIALETGPILGRTALWDRSGRRILTLGALD